MLDEGSGKIVMSHSARNGERQVDMGEVQQSQPAEEQSTTIEGGSSCSRRDRSDEGLFNTSDQTRMTFEEFLAEAERFKRSGRKGRLPYFGLHVLWRFAAED